MRFEDFHILITDYGRQHTHWHAGVEAGNPGAAAEYVEVEIEAAYPGPPDEYTAATIKRAQSPSQWRRAAAILRLAPARARSGIPRHSGNCHHIFFAKTPEEFTYDPDGHQKSAKDKVFRCPTAILRLAKARARSGIPRHSGNCYLTQDGRFDYTWNAENRLIQAQTRPGLPPAVPRHRIGKTSSV